MSNESTWSTASDDARTARLEQDLDRRAEENAPRSDSATDLATRATEDPGLERDLTAAPEETPLISSGTRADLNAAGEAIRDLSYRPEFLTFVNDQDLPQQVSEGGAGAAVQVLRSGYAAHAEYRSVDPDSPEASAQQHNQVNDSVEGPREPGDQGALIQDDSERHS